MEQLFAGIPWTEVSTFDDDQRAGSDAPRVLHLRGRGAGGRATGGTIQTDILKEYIAQKVDLPARALHAAMRGHDRVLREGGAPVAPGLDLRLPHHEAGSTAAQELAFTLADGFAYVEAATARGLGVDDFAPRLSFFLRRIEFAGREYRAARHLSARAA